MRTSDFRLRVKGGRHGSSRLGHPRHRNSGSERRARTSVRCSRESSKANPGGSSAAPAAPAVKKPEAKQREASEKEELQEVDLSDEWATLLDESRSAETAPRTPAGHQRNRLLLRRLQ